MPAPRPAGKKGAIAGFPNSSLRGKKRLCFELQRFLRLASLHLRYRGQQPAAAGCQVISATHSADTKSEALSMSRQLAAESASDLKRLQGLALCQRERLQGETRPVLEVSAARGAQGRYLWVFRRGKACTTFFRRRGASHSSSKVCGN